MVDAQPHATRHTRRETAESMGLFVPPSHFASIMVLSLAAFIELIRMCRCIHWLREALSIDSSAAQLPLAATDRAAVMSISARQGTPQATS